MLVRSVARARQSCASFLEGNEDRIDVVECDFSSLASVRSAAAAVLARTSLVHVLVCNAAVMMIPEREESADGHEMQLATNYLGHFVLFWALRDAMLTASTPAFNSRLVNVASSGHHASEIEFEDLQLRGEGVYTPSKAYGQSKLAQIYMSNYIDRTYGPKGLHALSLMPGGILTNLQQHIPSETKAQWAQDENVMNFIKSLEQGAATTILAALGREWEGKGGKYLEDCRVARFEPLIPGSAGVKEYAYDQEKEERLWAVTKDLLGLKGE